MNQKLEDLGILFNIKYYWHKKISMPKDSDNNECPWYDLYETKKKPNNKDEKHNAIRPGNILCILFLKYRSLQALTGLKCPPNFSKLIVEDQTKISIKHLFFNSVGMIQETGRESPYEDCQVFSLDFCLGSLEST